MMIWQNMHKGVRFGTALGSGDHSWNKYKLYLKNKTIEAPAPNTYTVQVAGTNGVTDLTEYVYPTLTYKNRRIRIEFMVMDIQRDWASVYSKILNDLHGKKRYICFDEEKAWAYYGRVTINKFQTAKHKGTITIDVDCDPYKIETMDNPVITVDGSLVEGWLWDTLNFESGEIKKYVFNGSGTVTLKNGSLKTALYARSNNAATITNRGVQYSVPAGNVVTRVGDLEAGNNSVTISATDTVMFGFRRYEL